VPGALIPQVKQAECKANHSPPFRTEVKNAWSCTYIPQLWLHGVVLS